MREPKRLAHRQAERNKARALKDWSWDDDGGEPELSYALGPIASAIDTAEALSLSAGASSYQL